MRLVRPLPHSFGKQTYARAQPRRILSRFLTTAPDSQLSILGNRGAYKLAVPLPTKSLQVFSLPRQSEPLHNFLIELSLEDPVRILDSFLKYQEVKTAHAYDLDGVRIAGSTLGSELLERDWVLSINGKRYRITAPLLSSSGAALDSIVDTPAYKKILQYVMQVAETKPVLSYDEYLEKCQDLGISSEQAHTIARTLDKLGHVLYDHDKIELKDKLHLNVSTIKSVVEAKLDLPHVMLSQQDRVNLVAQLRGQLIPLEEKHGQIVAQTEFQVQFIAWTLFVGLSFQFILFARLTWWDFSWDVMEPVTYFTGFAETVIAGYFWYLFTGKEYEHMDLRERCFHWRYKALCRKHNFDANGYETLKQRISELEHEIKQFSDDPVPMEEN